MALQSPGVQVTVIDESFYTPAEPGTTPLIVVATAQDKTNGAGTGTASATTKANAGKAFKLTSQRDLVDLFGVPFFEKTASSTPIHGSERNEYGLLAAYSLLGVSNAAFIVRADVDLDQLQAQADAPGANPTNGQWWIDTRATAYGIQEWNGQAATVAGGQKFTNKTPIVLTDSDASKITGDAPKESVGQIGDYAVVFRSSEDEYARIYYKSPGNGLVGGGGTQVDAGEWVLVGSNKWKASHYAIASNTVSGSVSGALLINGSFVDANGTVSNIADNINAALITGVNAQAIGNKLYIYGNGATETDADSTLGDRINISNQTGTPLATLGIIAGNYLSPRLQQSSHTSVPAYKRSENLNTVGGAPSGSLWIKTTEPNNGARWRVKRWNSATLSWVSVDAPIYATTTAALSFLDRSGGGTNIDAESLFVQSNADEESGFDVSPATATFRVWRRAIAARTATSITSVVFNPTGTIAPGSKTFTIAESLKGSPTTGTAESITFNAASAAADAETIAAAINAKGFSNIVASVTAVSSTTNRLTISHTLGGDFIITDVVGTTIEQIFPTYNIESLSGTANLYDTPNASAYLATGWQPLAATNPRFVASPDAPVNEPLDGQLWFNQNYSEVDIMVHNGATWVGYRHPSAPFYSSAPGESARAGYAPIVSASNPHRGGADGTADGDLWISTADMENFPTIYRYNGNLSDISDPAARWELIDKSDQTTEDGILFADARWRIDGGSATGTTESTIADLLESNFLDPDAPDPALYPKGMLLWNLRRSGGNVKKYVNGYIDTTAINPRTSESTEAGDAYGEGVFSMENYWTDRWVTASGNNEDGSGTFGRNAQRKVVVQALKSAVDTSQEIRDEERRNFNIIAAPGYPELMSNLVNLNIDRGVTAFVIGDTPLRLASDATTLTSYGTNANLVTDNNDDGIVTYDEYMAVYYPNGFTTDLGGANAVVPASHMMLKTITLSDNVSFPWFAPAGTRRGGITNATAVGYIDAATGEFQTVALNEGQRDTLYDLKINPIPFFNGVGLIAYGQKTRARNASALDRINVARLIVYLRSQLNKLARPYIFEPNDKITRDEIKQAVESLLLELVGLRALYDFAVVCDESNNTPSRVDRNELYVDIAIEPVKAVEFIYIPLRVKNTGEI